MKLYYVPMTRATRPRWLLEEMGVPHELVRLDPKKGETRAPEHLKRHPLGHVPVLEDGNLMMFESAAICLYLADKFPEKKLIPPVGSRERALCYQWVLYAMTELEPPVSKIAAERRKEEGKRDAAVISAAQADFNKAAGTVDEALGKSLYLLGEQFSVTDVIAASCLARGRRLGVLDAGLSRVNAYVDRLMDRPAAKKATGD